MIVKVIQNLRNRMEAQIKTIQEMFNKDLEELKNKQIVMNTGIAPRSPALQADALPSELPGKLKCRVDHVKCQAG